LLSKRPVTSVNDNITGVVFVVLVGHTTNRDVVQDCLRSWLTKFNDYRSSFFDSREKFNDVIEIFVATGVPRDGQMKLHFSRGITPKIVRPWI
jgi:hypothetical protein